MTPQAPVGAEKRLPVALSVAVLALGASGCGTPAMPRPDGGNPDGGGCASPCFLVNNGTDGGFDCVCSV